MQELFALGFSASPFSAEGFSSSKGDEGHPSIIHYSKLHKLLHLAAQRGYNPGSFPPVSISVSPPRSTGLFPAIVSRLLLSNLSTMEYPALPLGNHLPDKHISLGGTFSSFPAPWKGLDDEISVLWET